MQTSGVYDISLKEEVSRRALTTRNDTSLHRSHSSERDDRYYTYDCDDEEYEDDGYERFRAVVLIVKGTTKIEPKEERCQKTPRK